MAADSKKPPIIKKIIKKGHAGHHGSSWKVAYADFVTAMMAFFLVMWLLAISSEAGRAALADYFNELTMHDAVFNGGLPSAFTEGGSQGPSILDGGCFRPKTEGDSTKESDADKDEGEGEVAALLKTTQEMMENLNSLPEGEEGGEGSGDAGTGYASAAQQELAESAVKDVAAGLGDEAAGQVSVERVKGGLRIQVMDREGRPIFKSGASSLTDNGRAILRAIGQKLNTIPNKVSIEGHTDALPLPGQRITNWELSAARASATRMLLAAGGLADDRVTMVAGLAATQPLPGLAPNDPANRRISLMIWDEAPAAPPAKSGEDAEAGATGAGAAATPVKRLPPRPGLGPKKKPLPPATGVELEKQLIERTMEKAAQPDLSTVGPPLAAPPAEGGEK